MLAIGIRFLMDWYMATHSADRNRAEWPPHPDRVFMALASALYESNGNEREKEALLWLEGRGVPSMQASDAGYRQTVTTYVPVNDIAAPALRAGRQPSAQQVLAGLQLLPDRRPRQPRQFPVAIPNDPRVYLIWEEEPDPVVRSGLESLCSKVIRLGHSASLVQMWVEENPPAPNLVPTSGIAEHQMRVTGPGRLGHLEVQYERGRRPDRSPWAGYTRENRDTSVVPGGSHFDDLLLVLRRTEGRRLGLESTLMLANRLRSAVVSHCPEPVPEWISGHNAAGRPSQRPHLAFLPLPFVGREHADGHLLGLALAVPKDVDRAEQRRCLSPVLGFDDQGSPRRVRLYDGANFEWGLQMEDRVSPPMALRSETWTRPARRWSTVTPIVFDRHAKGGNREGLAEGMVAEACQRIRLPRPQDVVLAQVSLHLGVPHSRQFPAMSRKSDHGRLQHLHAVVTFQEPVAGPVLLGAGRYRGYGLCRPVLWEGEDAE